MRNAKCVVRNGSSGASKRNIKGYYSADFYTNHSFSTANHKVIKGYEQVTRKT